MGIVAVFVADDQKIVAAAGKAKLAALDAGKGFEGGAGGAPALGAIAIQCIAEFISHGVFDGTAKASAGQAARC